MTTSGSTDFELAVDDYIEEAFERCGLEIRTGYDLRTAKRSLNLMFADWANRGLNRWTITQTSITLSQGTTEYTLDADTIDILSAVITDIKYFILASVVTSHAKSKLLDDAIAAPINNVIIVPNFIAKYPPNNPPAIVAKTPKNFEYVAIWLIL